MYSIGRSNCAGKGNSYRWHCARSSYPGSWYTLLFIRRTMQIEESDECYTVVSRPLSRNLYRRKIRPISRALGFASSLNVEPRRVHVVPSARTWSPVFDRSRYSLWLFLFLPLGEEQNFTCTGETAFDWGAEWATGQKKCRFARKSGTPVSGW